MPLGETLKEQRTLSGLTLVEIQNQTGISNAYLSMLENGKIRKPSANVLYKLSCIYKVDIEIFLKAAGIITDEQIIGSRIPYTLTPEEEKQLLSYLRFLRSNQSNQ